MVCTLDPVATFLLKEMIDSLLRPFVVKETRGHLCASEEGRGLCALRITNPASLLPEFNKYDSIRSWWVWFVIADAGANWEDPGVARRHIHDLVHLHVQSDTSAAVGLSI